jgi:choline dehydrogenase-like flavoprotein
MRNAPGCEGHARCLQGCPIGARQSMDVSYIPQAVQRGAVLWSLSRATRIQTRNGRAVGVEGERLDPDTRKPIGRFVAHARRAVVVSASAIWTPLLLRASGVTHHVGDGFQAHPGAAVVGRFEAPVDMAFGATQSYEVPRRAHGYKIESLSLPPELLAARLPGVGARWQQHLARLNHYAQWCSVMRMQAVGTVRRGLLGGARVRYEPTDRDVDVIKQSVALIVRMMFAAGAVEVYPGVARLPDTFTDADQADLITSTSIQRRDFHLMASHHFASARAHADPKHGVVDDRLQSHAVRDLYVMDASALPTNLGVNPQHTIMAITYRATEMLANQARASHAA